MEVVVALCHFCDNHGPSTIFCTRSLPCKDGCSRPPNTSRKFCASCHSLPEDVRFMLSKETTDSIYVSSNVDWTECHNNNNDLATSLKKAAVKCLSLEVSSTKSTGKPNEKLSGDGTSEAVMFDLGNDYFALSISFSVRDAQQARGFIRHFGVFVLTNSNTILLQRSGEIRTILQFCIARIKTLAVQNFNLNSSFSCVNIDWEKRKPIYAPLRNLSEFTDPDIYVQIHNQFVSILKLFEYKKEYRCQTQSTLPEKDEGSGLRVEDILNIRALFSNNKKAFLNLFKSVLFQDLVVLESKDYQSIEQVKSFFDRFPMPFNMWKDTVRTEGVSFRCSLFGATSSTSISIDLQQSSKDKHNKEDPFFNQQFMKQLTQSIFCQALPPPVVIEIIVVLCKEWLSHSKLINLSKKDMNNESCWFTRKDLIFLEKLNCLQRES